MRREIPPFHTVNEEEAMAVAWECVRRLQLIASTATGEDEGPVT